MPYGHRGVSCVRPGPPFFVGFLSFSLGRVRQGGRSRRRKKKKKKKKKKEGLFLIQRCD